MSTPISFDDWGEYLEEVGDKGSGATTEPTASQIVQYPR